MAKPKPTRIDLTSGGSELTHNPFASLRGKVNEVQVPLEGEGVEEAGGGPSLPAVSQRVEIRREKKGRGGKVVTLVTWLKGQPGPLEVAALAKGMARALGAGARGDGTSITVQGDLAERVAAVLRKELGDALDVVFGTA